MTEAQNRPPTPPAPPMGPIASFASSQLSRVLLIGFLILLLQVPLLMIRGVISERQSLRYQAIGEISSSWGGAQTVDGPMLVVPYRKRWVEEKANRTISRSVIRQAYFLPETLEMTGDLESESRYRGIFEVPVYLANLRFSGRFESPDFSGWVSEGDDILWDRAQIVVFVGDARAIRNAARLEWGSEKIDFQPGIGIGEIVEGAASSGFHVPLRSSGKNVASGLDFAFSLALQGSDSFQVSPFAKETRLTLRSNWVDPSFSGAWLPTDREIDEAGFEAHWTVPFLGRSFPQRWNNPESVQHAIGRSRFGAKLATLVDEYRMAERSAKYGMLFLALTFGTLWLFEVMAGIRVHSIQYLLVGVGLCLFYLLELSLAEHLGFATAYLLASLAVIGLISAYGRSVLGHGRRAATLSGVLIALYGYLFVLLRDQNYALLVGSLGLFSALAVVMYLTRKVDWGALGSR